MTKEKTNISIPLIVGLILMIISSFFTSVTGEIYTTIGEFFTYKGLINLSILFLLIIILLIYYHPKSTSKKKVKVSEDGSKVKTIWGKSI